MAAPAPFARNDAAPSRSEPASNLPGSDARSAQLAPTAVSSGSCYFRRLDAGWACGCRRFWVWRGSGQLQDGEGLDWCVCGHHACFHDGASSSSSLLGGQQMGRIIGTMNSGNNMLEFTAALDGTLADANQRAISGTEQATIASSTSHQITPSNASTSYQPRLPQSCLPPENTATNHDVSQPGSRPSHSRMLDAEAAGLGLVFQNHTPQNRRGHITPDSHTRSGMRGYQNLSGGGLGPQYDLDRGSATQPDSSSEQPLGVGPMSSVGRGHDRFATYSPSSDGYAKALRVFSRSAAHGALQDSDLPSTRQASSVSTDQAPYQDLSQSGANARLLPAIDVSNHPPGFGFEDLLQSATEMATPSIGQNTPDPNIPHAVVQGVAGSLNISPGIRSSQLNMPPPGVSGQVNVTPQLGLSRSKPGSIAMLTPSSRFTLSPPAFPGKEPANIREVALHLGALRKHISIHGSQITGLGGRVETLEHASFSQPPRDQEMHDKLDMLESRILDMESKVDDHAKLFSRIDIERSNDSLSIRKHREGVHENTSFVSDGSSASTNSATSSALLLAAEERSSMKVRLNALEERLVELEKSVPPSLTRPLEVEVVLIPWGRELRGLWISPDIQVNRSASKFTTQDSEEWINSRSVRSSSRMSLSLRATAENGWTSQAIHDWAEDADEWLVPRACGIKSVVYHRLKSRGFVKRVDLTSSGAKETQAVISEVFGGLLAILSPNDAEPENGDDSCPSQDQDGASLGLKSSFIPLRKIHGSSRLRFLAKAEMITPALWTAEFLTSSVIMRATGGFKRLFITHRESYLQRNGEEHLSWTWPKLRQLPRAGSGNEAVEEADARESYWAEHSVLDAPPLSVSTSFGSHASHHSQPVVEDDAPDSEPRLQQAEPSPPAIKEESSVAFSDEAYCSRPMQPITPLSEFSTQPGAPQHATLHPATPHPTNAFQFQQPNQHQQPRYNLRGHHRTVSVPLTEVSTASSSARAPPQQLRSFSATSKRIRSFETPSNPLIAQLPSFIPSPAKRPANNKRRKVDRQMTPSLRSDEARLRSRSVSIGYGVVGGGAGVGMKRGMTPTAYATPFSGNFTTSGGFGASIAATGVSGESAVAESDDEEAWKGVDDEAEDGDGAMDEGHSEARKGDEVDEGHDFDEDGEDEEEEDYDDEMFLHG